MYFSYRYACNICGDEKDLATDSDDGGKCHNCDSGLYRRIGESYDQDYVDQKRYEEQQDYEYEQRHKRW